MGHFYNFNFLLLLVFGLRTFAAVAAVLFKAVLLILAFDFLVILVLLFTAATRLLVFCFLLGVLAFLRFLLAMVGLEQLEAIFSFNAVLK